MKKIIFTAVIAIMSITTITAQEGEFKFGAKAGVNFASIQGDETDNLDGKTGFHIGGIVEYGFSEKFALQAELVYSTQGAKSEFTILDQTLETDYNLNYINLPILAKYYVAEGFSLEAGPQLGFLTTAEIDSDGGTQDIKDETSSIDFGLGLGASYKLDMGVAFSARYNFGLSNIIDAEDSDNDFKRNNGVFQISVGYFFN